MRNLVDLGPALVLTGLLLAIWQGAAMALRVPKWLLPSPFDIAAALVGGADLIAVHALRTLEETLIGLSVAFLLGVGTAVVMDRSRLARRALYPILVVSQTVPIVAVAPLLVIWFGYDILPKLIVVALVCFF